MSCSVIEVNRSPSGLVNFEGSLPPSSRNIHVNVQKNKQMHINTWWGWGSKEDGAIVFLVVLSEKPRFNGHKLNYSKLHLDICKNRGSDWILEEVVLRHWRPFISGDIKNSAEHHPEQTPLADCALRKAVGPDLQKCLTTSAILWYCNTLKSKRIYSYKMIRMNLLMTHP